MSPGVEETAREFRNEHAFFPTFRPVRVTQIVYAFAKRGRGGERE